MTGSEGTGWTLPTRVAETHSAVVLLVGDRAYKLKKPVKLDFLDFSTREAREAVAHREVALNRRLAPDVYLGVADVVGPDGEVCDHLVVMKRMPDERRLSTLVLERSEAGGTDPDGERLAGEVRAIARTIAAFHARATVSAEIAEAGSPEAVAGKVERDLDELAALAGDGALLDRELIEEVGRRSPRTWPGGRGCCSPGWTRGTSATVTATCSRRTCSASPTGRASSTASSSTTGFATATCSPTSAFLAMDLERLGAPDLARRFLGWYAEFSGEHHPVTLAHFYVAFRALIRSKVACVRARQGDASSREAAERLLDLAAVHLRECRVALVLVGGAPGTGKSTLAAGLGDRFGWAVLRSDRIRKELAGLDPAADAAAPIGDGIYAPAPTIATYEEMLTRARRLLELGEPVILDASWARASDRAAAAVVADATASELVELSCDAPTEVATQRIAARRVIGGDPSDATAEVAVALRGDRRRVALGRGGRHERITRRDVAERVPRPRRVGAGQDQKRAVDS